MGPDMGSSADGVGAGNHAEGDGRFWGDGRGGRICGGS